MLPEASEGTVRAAMKEVETWFCSLQTGVGIVKSNEGHRMSMQSQQRFNKQTTKQKPNVNKTIYYYIEENTTVARLSHMHSHIVGIHYRVLKDPLFKFNIKGHGCAAHGKFTEETQGSTVCTKYDL